MASHFFPLGRKKCCVHYEFILITELDKKNNSDIVHWFAGTSCVTPAGLLCMLLHFDTAVMCIHSCQTGICHHPIQFHIHRWNHSPNPGMKCTINCVISTPHQTLIYEQWCVIYYTQLLAIPTCKISVKLCRYMETFLLLEHISIPFQWSANTAILV